MPRRVHITMHGRPIETLGYTPREFAGLRDVNINTLKAAQVKGHPACVRDLGGPLWIPELYDAWIAASAGKPSPVKRPKKRETAQETKRGRKGNATVLSILDSISGGSR